MVLVLSQLALIGYVPGALIYRLPVADRARRAGLSAEERGFWAVMISVVITSAVVLALASMELYSFRALLVIDGLIALAALGAGNIKLLYRGSAPHPTFTALIPLAIVLAGLWLYFPAAEYIMGGKDPGTYMNEGIQIAQRGSLVTHDRAVASVPAAYRDLFFPSYNNAYYYSSRFMGFFLVTPDDGAVLGQFPHLLPAWIAVGYGLDGLTGTRNVTSVWAILGLVAIYLTGARLFGRAAAAAGAGLVAINVIQLWFGRYPNAEIVMQALLFGALLAWSRAQVDDDGFFAPVSASLLGLLLFLRFDTVLAFGGIAVAAALALATGQRRPRASFILTFALWAAFAAWYLFGLMQPYMEYPIGFIRNLAWWQMLTLIVGGARARGVRVGREPPRGGAADRTVAAAGHHRRRAAARGLRLFLPHGKRARTRRASRCDRAAQLRVVRHADRPCGGVRRLCARDADDVPPRSGAAGDGHDLRIVLLLQDQDRPGPLLDGAALPAGHPAGRDAADWLRGVPLAADRSPAE